MVNKLIERFLRYVSQDTQSSETSGSTPSTPSQGYFAEELANELEQLGLEDVHVSRHSYVTATIPSNSSRTDLPTIGFIAHMDTSPEVSGRDVKPQIVDYQGGDICVGNGITISEDENPDLRRYVGSKIITTDGTTLLGADDKAGIAEIITAAEMLMRADAEEHGRIRIAFTPDEEIGEGADHFDVERFGADFAYTMDGGAVGELEFENFNAAAATLYIKGRNIHPGYAKGKMINASKVAAEFISSLQEMRPNECPEMTERREGFFHITKVAADVEEAMVQLIIRDFDKAQFSRRQADLKIIVNALIDKYDGADLKLEIKEQYLNMREKIDESPESVNRAMKAIEALGITPTIVPIRGGTDGARLSFMGLPCPNIFAGGHNFHSRSEYVPISSMEAAVKVILGICKVQ